MLQQRAGCSQMGVAWPQRSFGVATCRKDDPGGWLRFQKRRWREAATARKRRRLEAAQQRERAPAGPQPAPRGDRPPLMMPPLVLSSIMTLCPEWT